jgi:glycosyltransferase involved in cell wall biosynthesis
MLRLQNRYKFDLVHAHWLIPQGLTAGLVRRWIGAPMLLTAHGADVFASRSRLRKAAARFATSRHDAVTVNSTAMRRQLEQLTGAQADVIPMGVDIKNFGADPAKQSHSDAGPPTILFVGRLAEKKGVEYLVRAMPAIRAHVPGVRLVVVGDGPRRSALEDEVREAGVADAVSFEGAKPNANLPSYYRQADVFVAPSVVASDGDTEALGVVFLEAAACRLPIVATRVGGISDIVKHEETGLLVEQKSPTEIAGAVVRVLGDRLLARHMGQRARQHVEANFSWNVVADRFAEKYEMLLGAGATEDQATLKAA